MLPGLIYSVLVPVDFSRQSVWALSVAAMLVKNNKGIIHLLHVVDSRIDYEKETLEKIRLNLFEFAREQQQVLGVSIIPSIERGNIFQSIGDTANRLGAKIIIMATHGVKGIQKVIGSFAVRVMLGSKIPVILIKDQFISQNFNKIIIPNDSLTTIDIVTEKVIESGKVIHGNIYLFNLQRTMSAFRKVKIMGQIKRILNKLNSAGFHSESIVIQNDIQDFTNLIIRYAKNINADMIAISLQSKKPGKEFQISDLAMNLINKAPIPIYVVNPEVIK